MLYYSVTDPPMANRKIQAKEAIQKRLRNPEAVLGKLKKRLDLNRKWMTEFMEAPEEW